jgi:hypothetical protein
MHNYAMQMRSTAKLFMIVCSHTLRYTVSLMYINQRTDEKLILLLQPNCLTYYLGIEEKTESKHGKRNTV